MDDDLEALFRTMREALDAIEGRVLAYDPARDARLDFLALRAGLSQIRREVEVRGRAG